MSAEFFIDTNILIYGYDSTDPKKQSVALTYMERGWNETGRVAISVQVLLEFKVNMVRKGMPSADVLNCLDDLTLWSVVDNTLELFSHGLELEARWQLSLWDAMILAAAKASGAKTLLTEDLNDGQDYGGVVCLNPFRVG